MDCTRVQNYCELTYAEEIVCLDRILGGCTRQCCVGLLYTGCRGNSVPVHQLFALNFWTVSNPVVTHLVMHLTSLDISVQKRNIWRKNILEVFFTFKIDIISVYILQKIGSCYRVTFPIIERLSTIPLQITVFDVLQR